MRDSEELKILQCAHYTRIWGDLVGLWFISLDTLAYRYNISQRNKELFKIYKDFGKLCDPIQERFNRSQRDFYEEQKKQKNTREDLNS